MSDKPTTSAATYSQRRMVLKTSGEKNRDAGKRFDISHLEQRAKGPGALLADPKHRKTLTGIL
uniref:Uncharacterized protein n=1 Tax=Romanomermis culicivorax TaxID=13658 RepID=A0A915KUT9_ROMCU